MLAGEAAAKDGDKLSEGHFGVFHVWSELGDVLENEIKRFGPSVELGGNLNLPHEPGLGVWEEPGEGWNGLVLDL